jgi:site-specific DNA-cytosine methylase
VADGRWAATGSGIRCVTCRRCRPGAGRRDLAGPGIGSLFSGYGGLERGVQAVLGGTVAWHSEIDPGACKILAHRYPDVPNLGDITAVDWSAVEPVDVLTGGFPCQDVSARRQARSA